MRRKNYKGKCEKRRVSKCKDVCRTYNDIQYAYSEMLQHDSQIKEFQCNVLIDGMIDELAGEEYVSDFLCVKIDDTIMIRECVFRKDLTKPKTVKLLNISRIYWLKKGITDWGIVIDAIEK